MSEPKNRWYRRGDLHLERNLETAEFVYRLGRQTVVFSPSRSAPFASRLPPPHGAGDKASTLRRLLPRSLKSAEGCGLRWSLLGPWRPPRSSRLRGRSGSQLGPLRRRWNLRLGLIRNQGGAGVRNLPPKEPSMFPSRFSCSKLPQHRVRRWSEHKQRLRCLSSLSRWPSGRRRGHSP